MVTVTVKVDISNLPNFEEKIPKIQERSLNLISQTLLRNLARKSPVDHGLLRQWFFADTGPAHITIKTPAEYARYPNDGTGPIYPKNGKVLAFKPGKKWTGPVTTKGKYKGWVFLKHSKGQKGQHFVENSIQETRSKIEGLVIKATREAFSQ